MTGQGNEIVALLIGALHASAEGDGPDEFLSLLTAEPVVEDTLTLPGERRNHVGEVAVVQWLAQLPAGIGFTAGNIRAGDEGTLRCDFTTDRPVRWAGTFTIELAPDGRVRVLRVSPRGDAAA